MKVLFLLPKKRVVDYGLGFMFHGERALFKPRKSGCAWVEFVVMDDKVGGFVI